MTEHKAFSSLLDLPADAPDGSLLAVISTFGVRDYDGDVVLPSAFTDGQEVPLVWSHQWDRPIGKGRIVVQPDRAIFDGAFFLDTADGQNSYRTVKNMGNLQEYSYGFSIPPGGAKIATDAGEITRTISQIELHEASPVLKGASIGTHTIGVKAGDLQQTFSDEADAARAAAENLVSRFRSLADLRVVKEGRAISSARRTQMAGIAGALREAADGIDAILKETEPAPAAPKQAGLAEAIRFTLAGVP